MSAITASQAVGLSIGKLSQLTGVNIETIRYYEKIKVLPVASRTKNGRRVYGPVVQPEVTYRYSPAASVAWQSSPQAGRRVPAPDGGRCIPAVTSGATGPG
jgi:hypothetical protein